MEADMSRVQLALNVSDLDAAVAFYSKVFATAPAKLRPGYANFAIAEPPLKLVLIEGGGGPGSVNHLGVEVDSVEVVVEDEVTCCYAVQDKVWVTDPDGVPWEIYTVLADSDVPAACCVDDPSSTAASMAN